MQDELKRCPFCGGKASFWTKQVPTENDNPIFHDFRYEYSVRCDKCRASIGPYKRIDSAKKAWNRRADNA